MKPPTRPRSRPTRFDTKSGVQATAWNRNLLQGWTRKDKLKVLEVLKQQESSSRLDLSELQKTLPERSLQQIEDVEKTLKSSLAHKVFLHVRNQRKKQRESRVPIEIWGEMLQKTSQSYERTVSTAFSQMFLLAAMEPSSLIHSHPPSSIASSLQPSPLSSTHVSPSQTPKSPRRRSATLKNTATSPRLDTSCSDKAPTPKLSSSPETRIPSSPSTLQRPRFAQWVVNFDNIYRFLSTGGCKCCKCVLTPSESAVILDLLMSLPEELPLLKSKELQHHFLQAYDYLSKPAVTPASTTAKKVSHASATATKKTTITKRSSAKPASQSSVRKPTSQSSVRKPASQSTATEPTNQSAISQPNQSSVKQPTSQSSATEPINQSQELTSQLSVSQPTNQSSVKEPTSQSLATEPINQSLESTSQSPATEAADSCPLNPLLVPVALLKRQSHG